MPPNLENSLESSEIHGGKKKERSWTRRAPHRRLDGVGAGEQVVVMAALGEGDRGVEEEGGATGEASAAATERAGTAERKGVEFLAAMRGDGGKLDGGT